MKIDHPDLVTSLIAKADDLQKQLDRTHYQEQCTKADKITRGPAALPTNAPAALLTTIPAQSGRIDRDFAQAERRLKRQLAATPATKEQRARVQQELDALLASRNQARPLTWSELLQRIQEARFQVAKARQRGDEAEVKAAQSRLFELHREKTNRGGLRVPSNTTE